MNEVEVPLASAEQARVEFGLEIRAMRGGKGWTQDELAAAAGVSKRTIGNLENGKVTLQPGTLGRVLDALGYRRAARPWSDEIDGFLQMVGFKLSLMDADEQVERINAITLYLIGRTSSPSS